MSERISLEQMLSARERRADIQKKMLEEAGDSCLVCLTMNIAGDVKRTEMIRLLFYHGVRDFEDRIAREIGDLGVRVSSRKIIDEPTGCEAFWLITEDTQGDGPENRLEIRQKDEQVCEQDAEKSVGQKIKKLCEGIEDAFPAARLFDFDVLIKNTEPSGFPNKDNTLIKKSEATDIKSEDDRSTSGTASGNEYIDTGAPENSAAFIPKKLSRERARRCLICERDAAECARNRTHGLAAVKEATGALLEDFCAKLLSDCACNALYKELYTTPKPGLVDRANNGAHLDMDIPLFERSVESLRPYFYDVAKLGMRRCSMKELRLRGLAAEKDMFETTGGVNTHKGIIYSMGLLVAGAGQALNGLSTHPVTEENTSAFPCISSYNMSRLEDTDLMHSDVDNINNFNALVTSSVHNASLLALEDAEEMMRIFSESPETNGARVMKQYGVKGATAEAASGFPSAVYTYERIKTYSMDAGALALCDSMSRLEDTNILHRGGREGLEFVQKSASAISALPISERREALTGLDEEMIKKNLSPGGSADMLALAFLLCRLDELFI